MIKEMQFEQDMILKYNKLLPTLMTLLIFLTAIFSTIVVKGNYLRRESNIITHSIGKLIEQTILFWLVMVMIFKI